MSATRRSCIFSNAVLVSGQPMTSRRSFNTINRFWNCFTNVLSHPFHAPTNLSWMYDRKKWLSALEHISSICFHKSTVFFEIRKEKYLLVYSYLGKSTVHLRRIARSSLTFLAMLVLMKNIWNLPFTVDSHERLSPLFLRKFWWNLLPEVIECPKSQPISLCK